MKDAGKKFNLNVKNLKDFDGDFKITDKIIECINKAGIIIADLTNERPNVYFELGYARGIEKEIISVAKTNTELHFDVKDWKTMFYSDSRELQSSLEKRFKNYTNKHGI
jgi:nucleoside 2-deoxyribosyltransferase